jgi:hypothetical protein
VAERDPGICSAITRIPLSKTVLATMARLEIAVLRGVFRTAARPWHLRIGSFR